MSAAAPSTVKVSVDLYVTVVAADAPDGTNVYWLFAASTLVTWPLDADAVAPAACSAAVRTVSGMTVVPPTRRPPVRVLACALSHVEVAALSVLPVRTTDRDD